MESLKDKINPKIIKNALSKLSKGSQALDIAYKDAIQRIDNQPEGHRGVAKDVISWIVHAKRRLTTEELREALAIEPGSKSLDEENFTEIEEVVNSCAGLVTIDDESHIIRLVHYTTEEYFQKCIGDWIPNAPERISVACLTYLTLDTFTTGACSTDEEFETRLTSNVLFDYASRHWADHLISSGTDVNDLALQFLLEGPLVQSTAQALFVNEYRYSGYSKSFPEKVTGLHLAAHFGLDKLLVLLVGRFDALNSRDGYSRTPLSYAAEAGHEAVVKLLLVRSGVDVNARDGKGQTPLSYAAEAGHETVVKLLLACSDADVNVNARDGKGRTPLSYAAEAGHEAMVKLLLACSDADVNVNVCDGQSQTPLPYVAEAGHEAVVKPLLARSDSDVNVNADDWGGRTPLSYAAARGREAVVKLLLARSDADVNACHWKGRTPLSYAVAAGHEAVMELLESHGALSE
jgi:ankyrin repeat protein